MISNPRILIVRLSSIGDVLHCTPVARTLKEALPACHITWIVGKVSADMLRYNPYIDELYVWPREQWEQAMRSGKLKQAWRIWQQLRCYFHGKHYDIALDIHGLFISGMVTAASQSVRRIGLSQTKELNSLFMTETAPVQPAERHVIQRYLSILKPLNIAAADYRMTLITPPAANDFANDFLLEHGIGPEDRVVAVNPVTTWAAKNWPPDYFAQVIREISSYAKILLCGGPADQAAAAEIIKLAKVPVVNAVAKTSLLELAALLKRSAVLVVGDTGPLHMAIAVGTPSVSIFGATDPLKFGPLEAGHIALAGNTPCAPCHKTVCPRNDLRCLHSTDPATVIRHTLALLCKPPA
ncbi:glycosyltransferase family 9 protein|uniref:Lipopolysaccharide heptosyltransferase I n=1 Tax=Dendrosporobacter quercicolus TaxID=146817 RepID=A0A1G9Q316_9FIRM|nr:glycosyltransferase family 9 protein [Dendrosporobacter quercicolus]NSL48100.1 glycosyltransferase family 9 protein [Dendrosporobacter quercicolus DSM 1736]SDM05313.1 lipopolysaccharide heptosyltransferase I [Dendrosporobacter quercicolus]